MLAADLLHSGAVPVVTVLGLMTVPVIHVYLGGKGQEAEEAARQ